MKLQMNVCKYYIQCGVKYGKKSSLKDKDITERYQHPPAHIGPKLWPPLHFKLLLEITVCLDHHTPRRPSCQ